MKARNWTLEGRTRNSQILGAIISRMETREIIESIDAEIMRLQRVRALLTDHAAPLKPRRKVSAESRARMSAAQRARRAKATR